MVTYAPLAQLDRATDKKTLKFLIFLISFHNFVLPLAYWKGRQNNIKVMKANKEFRKEVVNCVNCGKKFHPRYSSVGIYCSNKCQQEYLSKMKYQEYLNNPDKYYGMINHFYE